MATVVTMRAACLIALLLAMHQVELVEGVACDVGTGTNIAITYAVFPPALLLTSLFQRCQLRQLRVLHFGFAI
jgi:hypothetical protein